MYLDSVNETCIWIKWMSPVFWYCAIERPRELSRHPLVGLSRSVSAPYTYLYLLSRKALNSECADIHTWICKCSVSIQFLWVLDSRRSALDNYWYLLRPLTSQSSHILLRTRECSISSHFLWVLESVHWFVRMCESHADGDMWRWHVDSDVDMWTWM